jgi:hypothetical protein
VLELHTFNITLRPEERWLQDNFVLLEEGDTPSSSLDDSVDFIYFGL